MALYVALARPLRRDARGMFFRVTDAEALVQGIQELLTTLPGERPMRPTWGSMLRRRRWEPNDDTLAGLLRDDTAEAIARHERRVTLARCVVTRSNRSSTVTAHFRVKASGEPGTATVTIAHEG